MCLNFLLIEYDGLLEISFGFFGIDGLFEEIAFGMDGEAAD